MVASLQHGDNVSSTIEEKPKANTLVTLVGISNKNPKFVSRVQVSTCKALLWDTQLNIK